MNAPKSINIFEYVDYKEYLKDWRIQEKKKNPGLTHEYLCACLKQKNRSYFNDIESGRKTIGSQVLDRLIKLVGVTNGEAKYLRALIGYGQPATHLEKEYWFEQIAALNNTPKKTIDKDTFQYFKEWHHAAVRSLLDTMDFKNDYGKIIHKLYNRITLVQAQQSISLLLRLNLIKPNNDGFLKSTEKILTTGDHAKDECLHRYQVAQHAILGDILQIDAPGTHDSTQMTVSVSPDAFNRIIQRIKQMRSEIISIAHKDEKKADRIFTIAVHAYPMSRKD